VRLIKPSVEIISSTPDALKLIELAGRTCYKSEDKITEDSAEKFVAMILKRGHESVLEHAAASVRFVCARGVSHELVRHRIASFSQESTRYCDYAARVVCGACGGSMEARYAEVTCPACDAEWLPQSLGFMIPPWYPQLLPGEASIATDDAARATLEELGDPMTGWLYSMQLAEDNYLRQRHLGERPEQARSVLPNSLKTELVMTANLREWRLFFKLRTAKAAHPQMREVSMPLLRLMQARFPGCFDDIEVAE